MQKSIILAGAVALALFASTPTLASQVIADSEFIGEATPTEADYEAHTCLAPSTADSLAAGNANVPAKCDNGKYIRSGFGMSHGFSLVPYAAEQWTGRVESWLRHDGDDRGFQCTFRSGTLVGCSGIRGTFPALGAEFTHECLAFETRTPLRAPIAETNFGCSVFGSITRTG